MIMLNCDLYFKNSKNVSSNWIYVTNPASDPASLSLNIHWKFSETNHRGYQLESSSDSSQTVSTSV